MAYEFIKSMLEKFQYLEDKFSEIFWLEFSSNLSTTILNNKLIIAVLKNELLKIIDSVRVICRALNVRWNAEFILKRHFNRDRTMACTSGALLRTHHRQSRIIFHGCKGSVQCVLCAGHGNRN